MGTGGNEANAALVMSWRRSLHNKSPRTVKLYVEVLGMFATWLAAAQRPAEAPGELVAVRRRDIDAWLTEQRETGLSVSTVRSRWIALRSFYNWALEEEEVDTSPVAKVVVERAAPPPVPIITDDQVAALLAEVDGRQFIDRRDSALFRMMLATGLRRAEICGLALADVDLDRRVVFVAAGKGDRARFSRFDAETAKRVDRYLRIRARHRLHDLPALWLTHIGGLTVKGLATVLAHRSTDAGIGHVHPHQLRHTWADRLKRGGMSDESVMVLGGWSDSKVMRRYGDQLALERALAAYDIAAPMNGVK